MLDLWEVILSNQTLDDSGNEFSDLLWGHLKRLLSFHHESVADFCHVFLWRNLRAVSGENTSEVGVNTAENIEEIAEVGSVISSDGVVSHSRHSVKSTA